MMHAGIARHALIAVSGALAAGWLLTACGDDSATDTETTPETTETTSETSQPVETTEPAEGENTIEVPSPEISVPSPSIDVPSPDIDVPSPEMPDMPEVTPSPVP